MQIYNYNAYQLGINSFLPLPELEATAEVAPDLIIRLGKLDWSPPSSAPDNDVFFELVRSCAYFSWSKLGKFSVSGGKEIVIDPSPNVDERILRLPLLGTVMATLLHQRGRLVLHASAVGINGGAVIFLGNKGSGKSTMAATLYGRGHELLADDVVVLDFGRDGCSHVLPGYPQVKLYPDVISSLGRDPGTVPELYEGSEKRGCRLNNRFSQRALPVSRIYAFAGGPEPAVKRLQPQEALLKLISNSYVTRFGNQLLADHAASRHLQQCTALIDQVRRLERPAGLPLLSAIAQLVEEDSGESKFGLQGLTTCEPKGLRETCLL